MLKPLTLFLLTLLLSYESIGAAKVSKEQLHIFNSDLIAQEEKACLGAKSVKTWLLENLKTLDDSKPIEGEIKKTECGPTVEKSWVYIKKGTAQFPIALVASLDDCKAIAQLMALIDWQKKSGVELKGSLFGFASSGNEKVFRPVSRSLVLDSKTFDPEVFLNEWIKLDQTLTDTKAGLALLRSATGDIKKFDGILDKETLKNYKKTLKDLENIIQKKPETIAQLTTLYDLSVLEEQASELRTLRQVYMEAQKGQWEKAENQFKGIENYSCLNVWPDIQKGKPALDTLMSHLETTIDQLEQSVLDNFFKVYKNIENLDKV